MKMVAMVIVLCTSKVFVVNIKDGGKKGMYGVNKLNMDTHEHLVNLKVNINYFHFNISTLNI